MRLDPHSADALVNPIAGLASLDEILGHNAGRNGGAPALFRPGGAGLSSWREVDASVSALAETLAAWRLGEDTVVGVQLGSSPEAAIACLALWRAGLIPAMLPLAWRRREMMAALGALRAGAILTLSRGGGAELGENGCEVAAELETIRYLGCFGADAPDGATPLDEVLARPAERFARADRPKDAADHVAVVTFDAGGKPVARSHNELLAAALMPLAASRLSSGSALVSTLDLSGLAGLATALVPWIASCCTAVFHQASSTEAFAAAVSESEASHLIAPGRLAQKLMEDGAFDPKALSAVTLVWRAPDGRAPEVDLGSEAVTVDVSLFGEIGLYAASRASSGRFSSLPLGPAGPEGFPPLIELRLGQDGRLATRGPACPSAPCPAEACAPRLAFDEAGFIETGLFGLADRTAGRISLGGRRSGVIQTGGLALSAAEVDAAYRASGAGAAPSTREDPVFGTRLALGTREDGSAPNHAAVISLLKAAGFGPGVLPVEPDADAAPMRRSA